MASAAQSLANQANAQHSTGPRTQGGKDRSARNSFQHGLTGNVLSVEESEQQAYNQLRDRLRAETKPDGALEEETFNQLMDGVWRLRKIRVMIDELFTECGGDPLASPAGAARLTVLQRYRANAEMLLYRSAQSLRELQTAALFRVRHLTNEEDEQLPPLVDTGTTIVINDGERGIEDRQILYEIYGFHIYASRFDPEYLDALRERLEQQPEGDSGDTASTA